MKKVKEDCALRLQYLTQRMGGYEVKEGEKVKEVCALRLQLSTKWIRGYEIKEIKK